MNHFWPSRPNPEGFSIDKLAKVYRDKLSKSSNKTNGDHLKKELPKINNIKSRLIDSKSSNSNVISIHWANRDFHEYRDIA